jgi:Fur family zinc uptake transcriptional regulator
VLEAEARPLSAYELLGQLQLSGIKAPPTVYRALNQLIDEGRVHRLESINAYVACCRRHHHGMAAFAICRDCGTVTEFESGDVARGIQEWADHSGFRVARSTVELHGRCADCGGAGDAPESLG